MCTIALLIDIVEGAPLVLAANRDELYARETRAPDVLSRSPRIVGGKDLLSGGTWLAVRADGRFAAVTNQRALATPPPGLRSRGHAVLELAASDDPGAYVDGIDATRYASMNLVWSDARGRVAIAHARREDGTVDVVHLPPGVHVLCNDRLGSPGFPRGERLAAALPAAPRRWPDAVPAIAAALADHTRVEPPPSELPPEIARELTATCIHSPAYGTRSASIVAARPGATIAYLHADGPPCTAPFEDRTELLA
ncbi:MAG: NRDE family protein [Deltaproteobacteria bacterium]|nr:NRDE family protein [Deltaproteobacteria bacterium]